MFFPYPRKENNNVFVDDLKEGEKRPIPNPCQSFLETYECYPEIMENIERVGFVKPTPIQVQVSHRSYERRFPFLCFRFNVKYNFFCPVGFSSAWKRTTNITCHLFFLGFSLKTNPNIKWTDISTQVLIVIVATIAAFLCRFGHQALTLPRLACYSFRTHIYTTWKTYSTPRCVS